MCGFWEPHGTRGEVARAAERVAHTQRLRDHEREETGDETGTHANVLELQLTHEHRHEGRAVHIEPPGLQQADRVVWRWMEMVDSRVDSGAHTYKKEEGGGTCNRTIACVAMKMVEASEAKAKTMSSR